MRDVARATRASLAALAGGAALPQALRAAGSACDSAAIGGRFTAAAEDLGNDGFRADVLGRLPWSPAVVGLLLARAPKSALAGVASSSLDALPPPRLDVRAVLARAYVVIVALLTGSSAGALAASMGTGGGEPLTALVLAGLAFALAGLSQGWAMIESRSTTRAQLLHWFVAAERAGVPPGAVLEPMISRSPVAQRPLERLRRDLRGVDTVRDAITVWAETSGLRGPAARLAGLVPDGDDPIGAARRMARIAALDPPSGAARALLHASYLMVAFAALTLGRALFAMLAGATP